MYRIRDKSLRRYFVHRFQEFKQAGRDLQRKRQQWDYGLMGLNRFNHPIPNARNTRYRMIGNAYRLLPISSLTISRRKHEKI